MLIHLFSFNLSYKAVENNLISEIAMRELKVNLKWFEVRSQKEIEEKTMIYAVIMRSHRDLNTTSWFSRDSICFIK